MAVPKRSPVPNATVTLRIVILKTYPSAITSTFNRIHMQWKRFGLILLFHWHIELREPQTTNNGKDNADD